jgi:hypothetical protein
MALEDKDAWELFDLPTTLHTIDARDTEGLARVTFRLASSRWATRSD